MMDGYELDEQDLFDETNSQYISNLSSEEIYDILIGDNADEK